MQMQRRTPAPASPAPAPDRTDQPARSPAGDASAIAPVAIQTPDDALSGVLARALQSRAAADDATAAAHVDGPLLQRLRAPRPSITICDGVRIDVSGYNHIRRRHSPFGSATDTSTFFTDVWDDLWNLLEDVITYGSFRQDTWRSGDIYEYEFDNPVGWDGPDDCYWVRVVVDNGWVTTAYPLV